MKIYPLCHGVTFHPLLSFFLLYPLNNVRKSRKKVYYILYLLCTGIEVDYKGIIAGIPSGPMTRRCLLLCWTGYHPSQCEIGKFLDSGSQHACRQDKLQGAYVHAVAACNCILVFLGEHVEESRVFYYGGYHFHFCCQWPERLLNDSLRDMIAVEDEDRVTVHQKMVDSMVLAAKSVIQFQCPD